VVPRHRGIGATDVGKRRQSNEDAFYVDDMLGLYVVADGMGGHAAGEVASQEAVETVYGMVKRGRADLNELYPPLVDPRPAASRQELVLQDVGRRARLPARGVVAALVQSELSPLNESRRDLHVDPDVVGEHEPQLPAAREAVRAEHPADA